MASRIVLNAAACCWLLLGALPIGQPRLADAVVQEEPEKASCALFDAGAQAVRKALIVDVPRLTSATSMEEVAELIPGQSYRVVLWPQSQLAFSHERERTSLDAASQAGILRFRSAKAGEYRVYLSAALWVDVLEAEGGVLAPSGHKGSSQCPSLRKYVAYQLQADTDYLLQLSAARVSEVYVQLGIANP